MAKGVKKTAGLWDGLEPEEKETPVDVSTHTDTHNDVPTHTDTHTHKHDDVVKKKTTKNKTLNPIRCVNRRTLIIKIIKRFHQTIGQINYFS